MSINIDQLKNRLKQIQSTPSGGNSGSEYIWKAPVGKSQVRIVPYAYDKTNPFIELYFHYEIGKKVMVSPSSFGRPDPIIEFADKLTNCLHHQYLSQVNVKVCFLEWWSHSVFNNLCFCSNANNLFDGTIFTLQLFQSF